MVVIPKPNYDFKFISHIMVTLVVLKLLLVCCKKLLLGLLFMLFDPLAQEGGEHTIHI